MERGLLWLPLLIVFIWLAWSGWNEYQKVEAYGRWAAGFEKAKYDIYAVLGRNGEMLTWGKPTRKGPTDLETFSLQDVESISLIVDRQVIQENIPSKGNRIFLNFKFKNSLKSIDIPFTEIPLANSWRTYLQAKEAS